MRSTNFDVLYFTFDHKWEDWAERGFPDRSSLMLKNLCKDANVGKVILLNSATSIFKSIIRKRSRNWVKKSTFFGLEKVEEKLYLLHQTRFFPKDKSNLFFLFANSFFHDKYLISTLNFWIKKLNLQNYIFWFNNPLDARFIGKFNERVSVYDVIDDWIIHPDYKNFWHEYERSYRVISEKADVVFAPSESLKEKFLNLRRNKNVFLVPNGVEWELFEESSGIPDDLENLPKPILGYVGALQERVDRELVERICQAFPKASLVMIGPVLAPKYFFSLKRFKNLYFLGEKNHLEIPKYIKNFDVCLLPHKVNEFTISMDPVKIYEYLAAGKPVVSTPIMSLKRFKTLIYFSKDNLDFIEKIRFLLRGRENEEIVQKRREFAFQNSWRKRIEMTIQILKKSLMNRG